MAIILVGCSRSKYRLAADREVYDAIAERNGDPRWSTPEYDVEIDPRSRYFDRYTPDCPPMPQDDPTANRYMQCVDGMKGWKHWYDNGVRINLENPNWQTQLSNYVDLNDQGAVQLDVASALKLAYVNSPNRQTQLETLYLSSLDVTTERFRLDTQYFGGYDTRYAHQGDLIPSSLSFSPILRRFVVLPPIDGVENNRLTVGRPFAADPALQARRRFATAGELLAGFANSFVFEFTGADANLSASLLNFTFLQPLLRGAGRDIALEQLTFSERALLGNLRSYSQFLEGFYTQVAIGEQGVVGPQRGGQGTSLQVFSGQASLGGYVGLLQQLQQIRNSEDNLSLQLRTLAQLEALLDAGVIDLVQVDQFRQNVERERANLLQSRNNYLSALDSYKSRTLGLPPDLPVDLDDSLIRQFQLVDRKATGVQDAIADLQDRVGQLPKDADVSAIRAIQSEVVQLVVPVGDQIDAVRADLEHLNESVSSRQESMDEAQIEAFMLDLDQLDRGMSELAIQFAEIEVDADELPVPRPSSQMEVDPPANDDAQENAADAVQAPQNDATAPKDLPPPIPVPPREAPEASEGPQVDDRDMRSTVILLREMLRLVQGSILVQARSRLEAVTVASIELDSEDAFQIALDNRLDFMNGRAALVDSWRLIQVNADALQSVLNVSASGDVRTARNNPLSFRAPTSTVRLGLEFDAPLTRLVERNNYREALINYQRSRRNFIQSRDSLHLGLRELLRQIEQLRTNLEIQRRAVAIAIRRVDLTRAALYAPVPPPRPGQRAAQFGPTAAINLLSAQSALRDTQNSFLSVWLNYYAAKMRLARELGIMILDEDGAWIEVPPPSSVEEGVVEEDVVDGIDAETELPPPLPEELLSTVDSLPEDFTFEAPADIAGTDIAGQDDRMIE